MDFIFSPIIESIAPAFNANSEQINITYTIPDKVSISDIKHIGIKIVEQNSNNSVVDTKQFPDSIIYLPFSPTDQIGATRTVYINKSTLIEQHWKAGTYYKIQMRFGTGPLDGFSSDITAFSNWKKEYLKKYKFSEWSTVMITKAIDPPKLRLLNEANHSESSLIINKKTGTEYSNMPLFEGVHETTNDEPITHFRFQLYNVVDDELIEDSGWKTHDLSNDLYYTNNYKYVDLNTDTNEQIETPNGGDSYMFKTGLVYDPNDSIEYKVVYSVRTLNLYETSTKGYVFTIVETATEDLPSWLNTCFEEDNEEGVINITLYSTGEEELFPLSGNYILSRTSEKSNYTLWEDIRIFNWAGEMFYKQGRVIFKDYTIESGVIYQYALSSQNSYKVRKNKKITHKKNSVDEIFAQVNFQYCYLYDNGKQLKLKYDNNMNSFKRTTLSNKQDTLGGRYPVIMRHGEANYSEFPINGLLSLHSDEAEHFFELKHLDEPNLGGYYYNDELVISIQKLDPQYKKHNRIVQGYSFNTNLTDNNIYIERMFREKAEAFLNDGRYKLFKSPTEGNIIVGLINISMTPNQQLGRMIYSFTSTAYEVMENTYDNLVKYGIQDKGNVTDKNFDFIYLAGQLNDLMVGGTETFIYNKEELGYNSWGNINLVQEISKQISEMKADSVEEKTYNYQLRGIDCIWFEPYPDVNYSEEILYLESQIAQYLGLTEKEQTIEKKIQYNENVVMLSRLKSIIARQRTPLKNSKIGIELTPPPGTGEAINIYLGFNQVYHLNKLMEIYGIKDSQDGLSIKILPSYTQNFEDGTQYNYYPPMICNYIATAETIENKEYVVNEVISAISWGQIDGIFTENSIFYESQTNNIQNNPMNIYNTLDVTSIIDKYVKDQVSQAYNKNNNDYFNSYDKNEDYYYNYDEAQLGQPKMYLRILGYELIDIECDKFNQITITTRHNEEYKVTIGPTHRYVLRYADLRNIRYIRLEQPAHCIINFQAQCSIEKLGEVQTNEL